LATVSARALSSLAENLVLLRFVEVRSRLYRLVSLLKVRDSNFDLTLHEYVTSSRGLVVEATSDSAEQIMAAYFSQREGESAVTRQSQSRRSQ
jgi:circadian clock protein KaiC